MTSRVGRVTLILAAAALMCAAERPHAQTPAIPQSRISAGEAIVDALAARQFEKVTAQFDTAMRTAMPDDSLQKGWDSAMLQLGAFVGRTAAREQQRGVYMAVIVSCELSARATYFFDTRYQTVNSRCSRGRPVRLSRD